LAGNDSNLKAAQDALVERVNKVLSPPGEVIVRLKGFEIVMTLQALLIK